MIKFPQKTRYKKIMKSVFDFFIKERITTFPIDPFKIIKKNKWGLIKYSELANEHGMSIEMVIKAYQSEDGYIIRDADNYTIAYNDTITNPGRIRFTLMHEIGHIYLNHLVDFNETILRRSKLTRSEYEILEREAHAFARNTLAPPAIVNVIKADRPILIKDILMSYFEITHHAAITRLQMLAWDSAMAKHYFHFYVERFKDFINKVTYELYCFKCGYTFASKDAKFCPTCGSDQLAKGMGDRKMIYDGYETENGRALTCPRCGNEELDYIGDFCKICGLNLINKCTNEEYDHEGDLIWACNTIAEGDARYCVECGAKTTYLEQKVLKPWNEILEEQEEVAASKENDPFADKGKPVHINDDELPF